MQKKLLPAYISPRIVKGQEGWYVVWYEKNPATGALERFRKSFSLNRIQNKARRRERSQIILEEISAALVGGGYIYGGKQTAGEPYTPISDALQTALRIKLQSNRLETRNTYGSTAGIFADWLNAEQLASRPVVKFGKKEAMAFLDHVRLKRGVGERTYNNYLICLKALFNELKAREYITVNPFDQVQKLRAPQKQRRNFTQEERRKVAAWISANDPGLFRAVLLSYYCFIRPNEMRQMQIGCIDIAGRLIRLPASITKTDKPRAVTIPESILPALLPVCDQAKPTAYLFGKNLLPGSAPCGKNAFNLRHREALETLLRSGAIDTIAGLSFYSWKDSGLTDLSEDVSILDLMKQAGHHDPKITMRYIHDRPADVIRTVKKGILE